jgi:hypothetical protein
MYYFVARSNASQSSAHFGQDFSLDRYCSDCILSLVWNGPKLACAHTDLWTHETEPSAVVGIPVGISLDDAELVCGN